MTDDEHIVLKRKAWFLIYIFLIPPWLIFLLAAYWYFIDVVSPLTLVYQSPKFSSQEVINRVDAEKYAIDEVHSNEPIWIYREVCLSKAILGEIDPVWYGNNIILTSPQRPVPPIVGCVNKAWPVRSPIVTKTNDFKYKITFTYVNNPLVHSKIELPPVPIRINSILTHDEDKEFSDLEELKIKVKELKIKVEELSESFSKLNQKR